MRITSTGRLHPLAAIAGVRRLVSQLAPDVVHAHSSFPGVYARAALLHGPRLVYTPHCFAFERRDVGWVARSTYRAVERALRGRADLLAAAGPVKPSRPRAWATRPGGSE